MVPNPDARGSKRAWTSDTYPLATASGSVSVAPAGLVILFWLRNPGLAPGATNMSPASQAHCVVIDKQLMGRVQNVNNRI